MSMVVQTPADGARRRRLDALAELLEAEDLAAAAAIVRADARAFGYCTKPDGEPDAGDVLLELANDVDVILLGDVAEHLTGGSVRRAPIRGRRRNRPALELGDDDPAQ